MSIGVGERKNEIYLYRPLELSSFAGSVQVSGSSNLWNKRLGYPLNFVIRKLLGLSPLKHDSNNKLCSVCLCAK